MCSLLGLFASVNNDIDKAGANASPWVSPLQETTRAVIIVEGHI